MKELSIEQKAERYDKAIEKAKIYTSSDYPIMVVQDVVTDIFPELIESEDERIRKNFITFLKEEYGTNSSAYFAGIKVKEIIAWLEKQRQTFTKKDVDDAYLKGVCDAKQELEKQGEQKSFDYKSANIQQKDFAPKVEPKFKVGDWVVNEVTGLVYQIKHPIENLNTHKYGYELTNDGYISSTETNHYHLWTIEDAKDGDVLISRSNNPFIYNGECNSSHIGSYCGIIMTGRFDVSSEKCHWTANEEIHPATKEQRDILFKAMVDAGYEFNFEKKELKKIKEN